MEGYIAEVRMFAGNFPPRGWAFCNGATLAISQYDALFALIGTIYGGDGQVTFALPDLRSRVAIHTGQGPGLSYYVIGQMAGSETISLNANNVSGHGHTIAGTAGILISSQDGHTPVPKSNYPAVSGDMIYSSAGESTMAPATVSLTTSPQANSGNVPIDNIQPFLTVNFIICLEGIFPSRN